MFLDDESSSDAMIGPFEVIDESSSYLPAQTDQQVLVNGLTCQHCQRKFEYQQGSWGFGPLSTELLKATFLVLWCIWNAVCWKKYVFKNFFYFPFANCLYVCLTHDQCFISHRFRLLEFKLSLRVLINPLHILLNWAKSNFSFFETHRKMLSTVHQWNQLLSLRRRIQYRIRTHGTHWTLRRRTR